MDWLTIRKQKNNVRITSTEVLFARNHAIMQHQLKWRAPCLARDQLGDLADVLKGITKEIGIYNPTPNPSPNGTTIRHYNACHLRLFDPCACCVCLDVLGEPEGFKRARRAFE